MAGTFRGYGLCLRFLGKKRTLLLPADGFRRARGCGWISASWATPADGFRPGRGRGWIPASWATPADGPGAARRGRELGGIDPVLSKVDAGDQSRARGRGRLVRWDRS